MFILELPQRPTFFPVQVQVQNTCTWKQKPAIPSLAFFIFAAINDFDLNQPLKFVHF